ncbi:GntR family transcriptional regulator [Ideonella livida]|uniref:GntR family transcriptional regulator n=1 Tax=Ideonella livida TaxID=2707176 RepID=A0A7C9TNF5_9BURK|nr:GntR family transcriptional regulator [Ideonella livida]NDY93207.1 GntR family transcriptional regulator [Ideonella livida]
MTRNISESLAASIEAWLRGEALAAGTPLPERSIAERFKVSRTPVRVAMQQLAQRGVIVPRPEGGYAVAALAPLATAWAAETPAGVGGAAPTGQADVQRALALPALAAALPPAQEDEQLYLRIAEDRLAGLLPDRSSENELMRRYDVTRQRLAAVLRRCAQEGWMERLPGNGWGFLPTLSTGAAYDQGYRLRILVEPAAILEPAWVLDEAALRRCRAEQQALVDGAAAWASPAQLFDANARLHELIAAFSGNAFMVDALKRVNQLRRLMEYRKAVDPAATVRRCREHLSLIDLLLSGQREAAADFMRLHLRDAAREKAGATAPPGIR